MQSWKKICDGDLLDVHLLVGITGSVQLDFLRQDMSFHHHKVIFFSI
jgi:hypothetical protein